MLNCDEMDVEDSLKEKDDRIRELEEIIAKQADMMKELQSQGKNRTEITEHSEQNGTETTERNGDNHREDHDQEDINENNNDNESLES